MLDLINDAAYQAFINSPSAPSQTHALVMHTATWCGPCKSCKPIFASLAAEWGSPSGGLLPLPLQCATAFDDKVDASACGVSAFPTFVLFDCVSKRRLGEIRGGGDLQNLRGMVEGHVKRTEMRGESLGGGGSAKKLSREEAREKMLARLGGAAKSPEAKSENSTKSAEEKMDVDDVNVDGNVESAADSPPKPPSKVDSQMDTDDAFFAQPNNERTWDAQVLETLTGGMGFSELRAKKGLMNGGFTTEGAIDWIMQHQDDKDIDDPIDFCKSVPATADGAGKGGIAQSYKCNECGKILSSMANLELHANKTGHSDFSGRWACVGKGSGWGKGVGAEREWFRLL